ncbi:MAG TPA: DUF5711 family protein [Lachnospiraceae bacterium]|nr:DUF5711 family protein [Lachnospiraceae bacterium]
MADIRSYTREKAKRNAKQNAKPSVKRNGLKLVKADDESLQEKIHKHKLTYLYRILLFILICGAVIAIVLIQYNNKTYTDYEITGSSKFDATNGTTNLRLGNKVLTYSKDGAYCTDHEGTVLWNQTYEMQSPIVRICEDVAAIADYNGGMIYILSSEKQLGTISTNLPIRDLSVAANGVVAAVLDDSKVTWIYVYDAAGKEYVKFHTTMDKTGYPVSISLSKDALLCAVSYVYIDAGVLKSSVAFYNFDEYGQNQIDNLVGGYDYTDTVVPYVQFMNDSAAFAVGDDSLMFYSGSQKPILLSVYYFDSDIQSIYYNEDYVGIVFYDENGNDRYRLEIYDKSGERITTKSFNIDYTDIIFQEDNFIIYNEEECMVGTMNNVVKFNGSFKETVSLLIPEKGKYHYLLVSTDSLDTIQLK